LNVTFLATAFESFIARGSAMFSTEHATPAKYHGAWRRRARAKGYVLHMGPADPDVVDGHLAGVGLLVLADFCATLMPPLIDSFLRAVALGGVLRVVLRVGRKCAVPAYVLYGYAGAHGAPANAEATNRLVCAIWEGCGQGRHARCAWGRPQCGA
jgi:hypothetical protein